MDFDLAHEFLLGATFRQRRLLNDFRSVDKVCLGINEFKAFGEATFAEEAPTAVSDNLTRLVVVLRIYRFHFLFNRLQAQSINRKARS